MAKPKMYLYTLRIRGAQGVFRKEVEAQDENVKDGILRFYTDEGWGYAVPVNSLVDMEVELLEDDEAGDEVHVLGHDKPLETVLPKEHV